MTEWWENLPEGQRRLLMIGVPVVLVFVLIARGRSAATPAGNPVVVRSGGGVEAPDNHAVGVGEISSYFNQFGKILSEQAERISGLENQPAPEPLDLSTITNSLEVIGARISQIELERTKTGEDAVPIGSSTTYSGRDAVVAAAYRQVLGRDPDPAGLAYWREQPLISQAGIEKALANTAEGRQR